MKDESDRAERRLHQEDYDRLLDEFGAATRPGRDAAAFLIAQGYTAGQARSAVYRFRQRRGLIGTKKKDAHN